MNNQNNNNNNSSSLTDQQQYVVDLLKQGKNAFVTGSAGTGKSFLIRHIFQTYASAADTTQICSMTGVSTVLLNTAIPGCKAKTIHSWSGIGMCNTTRSRIIDKVLRNKRCLQNWRKTRFLVIDEVSMMSQFILETLEELARRTRRNAFPFGGIQVVFTGDMFQLPPIGGESEDTGAFCFESPVWPILFGGKRGQCIELQRVFRQKDDIYVRILNEIRLGQCSGHSIEILQSRVGLCPPEDAVMTKLFPVRVNVNAINNTEYAKLSGEEVVFEPIIQKKATFYLEDGRTFDDFDQANCFVATDEQINTELQFFQNYLPCVDRLALKIGTIVMCLVNLDVDHGIVNGSQGRVIEMVSGVDTKTPVVEFTNGYVCRIPYYFWQHAQLPCITYGQIPLVLSWATTIHKSQGMTLSRAEIDLGNQIFEYGQAYVALSRVVSLDGLYLSNFNPRKIKANPRVLQFYSTLTQPQIQSTSNVVDTIISPVKEIIDPTMKRIII